MKCNDCGALVEGKWFSDEKLPVDHGTDPSGYDRDFDFCPVCGEPTEQ